MLGELTIRMQTEGRMCLEQIRAFPEASDAIGFRGMIASSRSPLAYFVALQQRAADNLYNRQSLERRSGKRRYSRGSYESKRS
jgi:hypothetical protein